LSSHLILAPMSGITDYPFRRLAKEMGCGLVVAGLVSAEGLIRKGRSFLRIEEDEHPIAVQLFGSNPGVLARAAAIAETMGADAVDINMGCPAQQVVDAGAGVDLMRSPERVRKILTEVRKTVKIPLTIKIRSGWDREHINAVEISKMAQDCGADSVALHPRTQAQGFGGSADWNLIGEVRKALQIPVVGNGDVRTPFLARKMVEETGCDGVMIGRGALGNPWIFRRGNGELSEGGPSPGEKQRVIERHFSLLQGYYGGKKAVKEIRKHVARYTKGLPSSASFRSKLSAIREKEELFEAIESYFNVS